MFACGSGRCGGDRWYWRGCSFNGGYEPVAAARQRFDVAGSIRIIAESLANLANTKIQAMLEIDESLNKVGIAETLH
jgi:hypothetical protein